MKNWIIYAVLVVTSASCAQAQLFSTRQNVDVALSEAVQTIPRGAVVIVGENHGFTTHQQQQVAIMAELTRQGHEVSVGMEFLTYTDQPIVNQFLAKEINETQFLKEIKWAGLSFDFYRDQILYPQQAGMGQTYALNSPREITSIVARKGLEGLSAEQKQLLPPNFEVGRDSYRARFLKQLPHLPNPAAADRYFTAQSIWDETMAWQATEMKKKNPSSTLVIVVGEFHVQFGGGLPDRLAKRWGGPIVTFSQVDNQGLSSEDIEAVKNEVDGGSRRADFMWLAPLPASVN